MSVEPIPFGDEIESSIRSFNKKAAGALAPAFLRALTNATEIFVRKDLGERFFAGAMSGGIMIWGVALLVTYFADNAAGELLHELGFHLLGRILGHHIIGVILNLGLMASFMYFANENAQRLQQFRNEGKTYHSMSRGVPRWGDDPMRNLGIQVGIIAVLLLFAPLTAILFGISRYLSAQEAAKQQAAMYDRYLDAMDAKIEGEHLQDALMGKCAPEVTYLYKPLPANMNPELRENVAAAATGKPVKIVVQAPKPARTV
jgi:hypothetical protein